MIDETAEPSESDPWAYGEAKQAVVVKRPDGKWSASVFWEVAHSSVGGNADIKAALNIRALGTGAAGPEGAFASVGAGPAGARLSRDKAVHPRVEL